MESGAEMSRETAPKRQKNKVAKKRIISPPERRVRRKLGGSEWESNPPATGNLPPAGFEDREDHRNPCASLLSVMPGFHVSGSACFLHRPAGVPTFRMETSRDQTASCGIECACHISLSRSHCVVSPSRTASGYRRCANTAPKTDLPTTGTSSTWAAVPSEAPGW